MTRPVKSSGGYAFTAISAYYQIREMTRIFGPLGIGWGWDAEFKIIDLPQKADSEGKVIFLPTLLHVRMKFWYKPSSDSEPCVIFYENCCEIITQNKWGIQVDDEAYKKLITDTLTKIMSMLGSGSDVFLGKYNDSRYVDRLIQEEQAEKKAQNCPESNERGIEAPKTGSQPRSQRPAPNPAATAPSAQATSPENAHGPVPPASKSNAAIVNELIADIEFIDHEAPKAEINAFIIGKFKEHGWGKPSDIPRDALNQMTRDMAARSDAVAKLMQVYGDLASVRSVLAENALSLWWGDPQAMLELTDRSGGE